MPSPSTSLATLRPDISESFMEFDLEMDAQGFIANQVFPVIEVASQAGSFGKIPLAQLLEQRDTKRAPGSGYKRGTFKFDDAAYACVEHGAEEPIDDREAKMYANYFNAEVIAGMRAYSSVLRNAEQRVSDAVFNSTTWTGAALTTAVSIEWSTLATAVPITNVEAAVNKVYDGSGLWPNALIINRKVFRNLRNCAQVIDRITASGAGSPAKASDVTAAMLAAVFDLPYVIVAGSSRNSATEGQTALPVQIWSSEYAMVAKVCTSQDFKEPGIGRTFHWSADGSQIGGATETYRDETVRSDIVRVRHDVAEIVLYAAAGHLLSNITA